MKHTFGLRSGEGIYRNVEFGDGAEILGAPTITDSKIMGGKIFGSPVILGSTILDSGIVEGYSIVYGSIIRRGAIISGNASVGESNLTGQCRVMQHASVFRCSVSHNVVVRGRATVIGCDLIGYADIHEGIWDRPPITYITEAGFIITEGIDDKVTVSCTSNKISKWLSGAGRRYGKLVGMTPMDIDQVQCHVEEIAKFKGIKC